MIKLISLINELNVTNPTNVTVENVKEYFWEHIWEPFNENKNENDNMFKEYKEICEPYCNKYKNYIVMTDYNSKNYIGYCEFKYLNQSDLNKLYREIKQLVQKHKNINELNINRPGRTYDIREENWPNLSSAIFDQIQIGDKIIDPDFIGIVYEKEYDDTLDEYIITYKDGKGGDKFINRNWFDEVSKEDEYL